MPDSTLQQIERFLACKRLAIVGVSRKPRDFSRGLLREFLRRGYEVALVNPNTDSIEDLPSFARLQDVTPVPEAALIMTPPQNTAQVIRDCREAGVPLVWLHGRAGGDECVAIAQSNGLEVIAGQCPFMFLPDTMWVHRLHGAVLRMTGRYPK